MKNLLIILISILLLSSPVIGNNHKGETLYLWFVENEMVWKGFGDKETQPKYQGDVKNGEPNGLGVIFYPDGIPYVGGNKYVGEWKDGKPNGQGTFTYRNGSVYVGEWKDGKKDGQGTYTYPEHNESKFVGEWKNDKKWKGTEYGTRNGNILYKIVNGKIE
jgi:hypothetical protein